MRMIKLTRYLDDRNDDKDIIPVVLLIDHIVSINGLPNETTIDLTTGMTITVRESITEILNRLGEK